MMRPLEYRNDQTYGERAKLAAFHVFRCNYKGAVFFLTYMYLPIRDYALIGNTQSAALVSRAGSIDWCCLPRFDSCPFLFRILDEKYGGCCALDIADLRQAKQRYLPGTNVLETTLTTTGGELSVTDFMPVHSIEQKGHHGQDAEGFPSIVRILRATSGRVGGEFEVTIPFDLEHNPVHATPTNYGVRLEASGHALRIELPGVVIARGKMLTVPFELSQGDAAIVVIASEEGTNRRADVGDALDMLRETQDYWHRWTSLLKFEGDHRDAVLRSALVLKALVYEPTGAIVAAPTTSLPEWFGGKRNWDYRYSWLRDSSLTISALIKLGCFDEARDFLWFAHRNLSGDPSEYRIYYPVDGGNRVKETNLDWVRGYRHSRPVRMGNAAEDQRQLDVFGELAHCMYLYWKHPGFNHEGECFEETHWPTISRCADFIASNWQKPGSGIWEMRGKQKEFTYATAMCWLMLDRALKLAADFKLDGQAQEKWKIERAKAWQQLIQKGFNLEKKAFVQTYGSDKADAALLRLPLLGVLDANDPRMKATVEFVERRLLQDGLVYRYRGKDGIKGDENTFTACAFWLIENYALQGRLDKAEKMFEHVLSYASDLGLFSEEINPRNGELTGNYPQGFTHIGVINAAVRIHEAKYGTSTEERKAS